MIALQKHKKMTADEFFAWALDHDKSHVELIAGEVVAMAPEIADHARAKAEIYITLRSAINEAGLDCEAFVDSLGVRVDEETVFEPDVLVNCGAKVPAKSLHATHPVIVVEVISSSSRRKDTGAKLVGYFRAPSIQHYLVIDLERRLALHHRRGERQTIVTEIISTGAFRLDPPGLQIDINRFLPEAA
jgi:Uma2 family endonuclease